MNLKQRSNLLTQNYQLAKEKNELEQKIIDLTSMLERKMSEVVELLKGLNDKQFVINSQNLPEPSLKSIKIDNKDNSVMPYIPTPDSSALKLNVQDLPKRSGKPKIGDSLSKLSKLQE
jgi:hypothetical protein